MLIAWRTEKLYTKITFFFFYIFRKKIVFPLPVSWFEIFVWENERTKLRIFVTNVPELNTWIWFLPGNGHFVKNHFVSKGFLDKIARGSPILGFILLGSFVYPPYPLIPPVFIYARKLSDRDLDKWEPETFITFLTVKRC